MRIPQNGKSETKQIAKTQNTQYANPKTASGRNETPNTPRYANPKTVKKRRNKNNTPKRRIREVPNTPLNVRAKGKKKTPRQDKGKKAKTQNAK
jgi:hypothetical protein